MNEERTCFALSCQDPSAPAPILTGVQAHGRLDAVLFELTLRQTYRNLGDRVIEVVYTFPLPPMAVLLDFASELNGQRQSGVIVARPDAERRYEESLKEGDAPVMLMAQGDGLHTANIGNLKPGEDIVLEVRFAQLLSFEQGRLRVAIPTTIAPRYGSAGHAGLQPQHVPLASLDARYPLALTLTIGAALAGAAVACPTHRFTASPGKDGSTCLDLAPGAWLDRDVVVTVTPREPHPSLLVRADDAFDPSAPVVMMAALQPPAGAPRERIALKVLVDCSGSMNGDSMASARAALRGVVAGLTERDSLSLSRFGSTVEHLSPPSQATPQALRYLRGLIGRIKADLGGTEMEAALDAVFALPGRAGDAGADVLLITDGEIWQAAETIAAARRSGHRVFAVGVGSAPAEGVLRSLAEATGGACEFATPGEAVEAAAQRMLHRMRQPILTNARVDWGITPAWTLAPLPGLFGGDTVIAFAGFSHPPQPGAIRLLADDSQGATIDVARVEADAPCVGDRLPRIAAARRVARATEADSLALALRYQLMSRRTNCFLVHRRADADKATGQAELHRVSSMLAAGWGGLRMGVDVMPEFSVGPSVHVVPHVLRFRSSRTRTSDIAGAQEAPGLLQVLDALALAVEVHLAGGRKPQDLSANAAASLHADAQRALDEVMQLGLSLEQAWRLLAHWINTRTDGVADADLAALLRPLLNAIDPALSTAATLAFERHLGGHPTNRLLWGRLRRRHKLRAYLDNL